MNMTASELKKSFSGQGEEFRVLFHQLENRTQIHGYLLTGEKGTGKKTLCELMASALLCSAPEHDRPCGKCRNCKLVSENEHPDLITIEKGVPLASGAGKERNSIPVEDIREMIRLCNIHSTEGNIRVVRIYEADKMTIQAQNCLLKTLEDPPAEICIILVSDHPESLLATVISRCRVFRMKAWQDEYILSVLNHIGISGERASATVSDADGSIGRALKLATNDFYWELRKDVLEIFFNTSTGSKVLSISNQWKDRKKDSDQILSILDGFIRKLAEARFFPEKNIDLSLFPPGWKKFSAEAEKERFVFLSEAIINARKQLQFSTNFQAVFEKLIFLFIGEGSIWQ